MNTLIKEQKRLKERKVTQGRVRRVLRSYGYVRDNDKKSRIHRKINGEKCEPSFVRVKSTLNIKNLRELSRATNIPYEEFVGALPSSLEQFKGETE